MIMEQQGKSQIDLLKLDIEGAELELFAEDYQHWLSNTQILMIELHDWFRKGCSKSFFSALLHYDFSITPKGENFICIQN